MTSVIDWLLQNVTREASCFATDAQGDAKKIDVEEGIARCTARGGDIGAGKLPGRTLWTCVAKYTTKTNLIPAETDGAQDTALL